MNYLDLKIWLDHLRKYLLIHACVDLASVNLRLSRTVYCYPISVFSVYSTISMVNFCQSSYLFIYITENTIFLDDHFSV